MSGQLDAPAVLPPISIEPQKRSGIFGEEKDSWSD